MLPTQAIKADPSVAASSNNSAVNNNKDSDATANSLEASFSSYFSQMMAALPALPSVASAPAQAPAPNATAQRPGNGVNQNDPKPQDPQKADQPVATDPANAAAQAAGSAGVQGSAQPTPQTDSTSATQGQAGTTALAGEAKSAATATGPSGASAAPAPAKPTPPPDPAPQAGTAADPGAATTQDALAQAYPGGKFQVQYGDSGTTGTTKAPLTEFVNQIQMDARPAADAQGASAAGAAASAQASAAALPATGLDMAAAIQTLQAPLAGTAALLAPALPETNTAAGTTLSGNVAAAQAVGAGALPGAAGSVRVTATTAAEAPATEEQNLLSQVDGSIKWLVKNQDKGAELQLHPESLGRIQIKLKVDGTVVHAKVWASEAATVPILQDHKSMLESSLKQQGLTLGSFDLQHGRKEQQVPLPVPADASSARGIGQALASAGQESPVPTAHAPARASRIEYVA
jgi:flagellar hook-length control protein FliK